MARGGCSHSVCNIPSKSEGSVEKKLKKEETYAMKTIRGLEKEVLESLRLKMTTDADELKNC